MAMSEMGDDRKRLDPYDPRTGATGNDEPNEVDGEEVDDDEVDEEDDEEEVDEDDSDDDDSDDDEIEGDEGAESDD
jgi:hypothetical protein